MNEDQFNLALNFIAQQRNTALDACVQLQLELAMAHEQIKKLELLVAEAKQIVE